VKTLTKYKMDFYFQQLLKLLQVQKYQSVKHISTYLEVLYLKTGRKFTQECYFFNID